MSKSDSETTSEHADIPQPQKPSLNKKKNFLYLPRIMRTNNSPEKNFYKLENKNNCDFEAIDALDIELKRKKKQLFKTKIATMKDIILNNKLVPERWIMNEDYAQVLDTVMKKPIVLTYAIICKDIHKKHAGKEFANDDEKYKHIKSTMKTEPTDAFTCIAGKKLRSDLSSFAVRKSYEYQKKKLFSLKKAKIPIKDKVEVNKSDELLLSDIDNLRKEISYGTCESLPNIKKEKNSSANSNKEKDVDGFMTSVKDQDEEILLKNGKENIKLPQIEI